MGCGMTIALSRSILSATLLGAVLVFTGCSTRGPANSDQLPSLAAQALPEKDATPIHSAPGEWFPNVRGFNDIRSNPFSPVNRQVGVMVLTKEAIYFEQWSKTRKVYDVVKRIPLKRIQEVTIDTYGASRRIVVQLEDYSYDSFGLTQAGGLLVDKSETEVMHRQLHKLLPDRVKDFK